MATRDSWNNGLQTPQRSLIDNAKSSSEIEMGPDCTTLTASSVDERTACYRHRKTSVGLVAFSRSCRLMKGVLWCGQGYVGRRGHHWSSLTETLQLCVTLLIFSVRLFYHFTNSSHVVSFISVTTYSQICTCSKVNVLP